MCECVCVYLSTTIYLYWSIIIKQSVIWVDVVECGLIWGAKPSSSHRSPVLTAAGVSGSTSLHNQANDMDGCRVGRINLGYCRFILADSSAKEQPNN